jgi:Cu/Ag efflux pump CusA
MLNRIFEPSLRNRFLILVFAGLVVGVGLYSLRRLPIDAVPDVTPNQVQILTNAPGLGPVEVEQFITFPVETAMSGLPGIELIRSVSRFGLSAVTVYFEEGMDIYFARRLVMERLPAAREAIPAELGTPEMGPISTGLGEIYQFEVKGEGYSLMELRSILEWDIAFKLKSVPGVVEVNTYGGELKTYEVQLEAAKLVAYNLPIGQVFEALERNNANSGGAYIEHAQEQYLIRGEGLVQNLRDLENIVVAARNDNTPIYIRNLGRVAFAPMVRQGAVTRDGRGEAVTGVVAIDFGLIVDGSVVMIENIVRHIAERRGQEHAPAHLSDEEMRGLVLEAGREVLRPIFFAVGIIIIVYLPLLTLQGVEGRMFRPMALTVVFALAGSLVLSFTLMPVLASFFLRSGVKEEDTWLIRQAKRLYRPLLARTMHHPMLTGGVAAGLFAVSVSVALFLGAEFIPRLDEGAIALQAWRLPSVSLEESVRNTTMIEKVLQRFPEVVTVVSRTGRAEIATDPMGVAISDIYAILKPHEEWQTAQTREALIEAFNTALTEAVQEGWEAPDT